MQKTSGISEIEGAKGTSCLGSKTSFVSLDNELRVACPVCRLKNRQSRLFQQLHGLKARQRTLLTGTPLQNNLQELWMLLHFLDAAKFESLEAFQEDFSDLSHGDQASPKTGPCALVRSQ